MKLKRGNAKILIKNAVLAGEDLRHRARVGMNVLTLKDVKINEHFTETWTIGDEMIAIRLAHQLLVGCRILPLLIE